MTKLVYLVPLFPLIGFLVNGLFWRRFSGSLGAFLGSATVAASFLVSLGIFFEIGDQPIQVTLFDFLRTESLVIPFAFQLDSLSAMFLLIITGIGLLIHIYSAGYMKTDPGVVKYFAFLNLFVFSMLLLVLGSNFLIMFIGWEGVGLCSYLLIGFWYKNKDFTQAGKKAFVMNRIGDLGFLVAMMIMVYHFGSLEFSALLGHGGVNLPLVPESVYFWIGLCLFIGATGKSAQIPLFTWLPDAMAGPTPVSALIHAATMVTAGVYLIARSALFYDLAPDLGQIILYVGLATALLAAAIAMRQNDIKKVLAYSTVSQLGFMFVALGLGAYTTALFHVLTHAFFKALLFLGSGSVIHAMGGEQDMWKMGGLGSRMKTTRTTFLIGCLAIAGLPGLSGFFSKDEILAHAYAGEPWVFVLLLLAALMTAAYIFRMYFLTFTGEFRGSEEQKKALHESPPSMTIPLVVLALLSIVGGWIGLPHLFGVPHYLGEYLSSSVVNSANLHLSASTEWMLMGLSTLAILLVIIAVYRRYQRPVPKPNTGLAGFLENKAYIDEFYDALITQPLLRFSRFLNDTVERLGIDGLVNGLGKGVRWGGERIRFLQSGQVGFYLFVMVIGMTLVFAFSFFWIQ